MCMTTVGTKQCGGNVAHFFKRRMNLINTNKFLCNGHRNVYMHDVVRIALVGPTDFSH